MNEPVRNFIRPTTDGRIALENHLLAIAQSAATKGGRVPPLHEVTPARSLEDSFRQVFGSAQP